MPSKRCRSALLMLVVAVSMRLSFDSDQPSSAATSATVRCARSRNRLSSAPSWRRSMVGLGEVAIVQTIPSLFCQLPADVMQMLQLMTDEMHLHPGEP